MLNKVGKNIKVLRTIREMSQEDLAKKAGVSRPNLSDIENGKINMTLTTFVSICDALDVTPSFVLEKEDFMLL